MVYKDNYWKPSLVRAGDVLLVKNISFLDLVLSTHIRQFTQLLATPALGDLRTALPNKKEVKKKQKKTKLGGIGGTGL